MALSLCPLMGSFISTAEQARAKDLEVKLSFGVRHGDSPPIPMVETNVIAFPSIPVTVRPQVVAMSVKVIATTVVATNVGNVRVTTLATKVHLTNMAQVITPTPIQVANGST